MLMLINNKDYCFVNTHSSLIKKIGALIRAPISILIILTRLCSFHKIKELFVSLSHS